MPFNRAWLKKLFQDCSAAVRCIALPASALLALVALTAPLHGQAQALSSASVAASSADAPDAAPAAAASTAAGSGFSSSTQPVEPPRFEAYPKMDFAADTPKAKAAVAQELIAEGLISYGNYKIFASGYDEKLFTAGIEYDRHSWGYFLHAQADYVAEFLPFVLLDKPLHTDIYGNPNPKKDKSIRQLVPGIGISPIGFRLQWRNTKRFKPYMEAKGGLLVFDKKVPSTEATYENFSLQSATGVQVKVTDRWGLRLGLFSDFHFSNDFIVPVDPGLDVMNANLGVSYHF